MSIDVSFIQLSEYLFKSNLNLFLSSQLETGSLSYKSFSYSNKF